MSDPIMFGALLPDSIRWVGNNVGISCMDRHPLKPKTAPRVTLNKDVIKTNRLRVTETHSTEFRNGFRAVGFSFEFTVCLLDFRKALWYCVVLKEGESMSKTIQDIFYGNLTPCERDLKKGSRMAELVSEIARYQEDLGNRLNAEEKALFEHFADCSAEMYGISECEAFVSGFTLGARIMIDVLIEHK